MSHYALCHSWGGGVKTLRNNRHDKALISELISECSSAKRFTVLWSWHQHKEDLVLGPLLALELLSPCLSRSLTFPHVGFSSAGGEEGSKSNGHWSHFWLLRCVQSNWLSNHGEICKYAQRPLLSSRPKCSLRTDLPSAPPVATSDCSDRRQVHACDGPLRVVHLHHSLRVGPQTRSPLPPSQPFVVVARVEMLFGSSSVKSVNDNVPFSDVSGPSGAIVSRFSDFPAPLKHRSRRVSRRARVFCPLHFQDSKPSSRRTGLHQSVLHCEVHRRSGLRRCYDLLVCHDSKDIPQQCGDCSGECRVTSCAAGMLLGLGESREDTQGTYIHRHNSCGVP